MRSKSTSPRATNRLRSLIFIGIFIILAAVMVTPFYSVRSQWFAGQGLQSGRANFV